MSKLGCVCGHVIRDQTDNVPHKAKFVRDQDFGDYSDKYMDDISAFIEAVKDGRRNEWIKKYFSETYPTNIDNSSIVFDIISAQNAVFEGYLYQCDNCGRIKVQVQDKNLYASFVPEDENYIGIFKRFRPWKDAS
jgi:hypothetical protein